MDPSPLRRGAGNGKTTDVVKRVSAERRRQGVPTGREEPPLLATENPPSGGGISATTFGAKLAAVPMGALFAAP